MSDQTGPEVPQPVTNALVKSGFPFQTAVAQVVRQCGSYSVVAEEVPWRDESGNDQFLDLVAVRNWFTLTVECKKTQKEMFTFLRPSGVRGQTNEARCVHSSHFGLAGNMKLSCGGHNLTPTSAESNFCVVSTSDSGKDRRMIERDVQTLVRGTEAHAERCIRGSLEPRIFIPLLVTNAKLFVADYDAHDVSLDTGEFSAMPPQAKVTSVDWIRFRKAFTSRGEDFGTVRYS